MPNAPKALSQDVKERALKRGKDYPELKLPDPTSQIMSEDGRLFVCFLNNKDKPVWLVV